MTETTTTDPFTNLETTIKTHANRINHLRATFQDHERQAISDVLSQILKAAGPTAMSLSMHTRESYNDEGGTNSYLREYATLRTDTKSYSVGPEAECAQNELSLDDPDDYAKLNLTADEANTLHKLLAVAFQKLPNAMFKDLGKNHNFTFTAATGKLTVKESDEYDG